MNFTKKIAILSIALLTSVATFAQVEADPAPPDVPGGPGGLPDAPIDGFIIAGLIAGAAVGLKKTLKKE